MSSSFFIEIVDRIWTQCVELLIIYSMSLLYLEVSLHCRTNNCIGF